jgi:hypothetical protein
MAGPIVYVDRSEIKSSMLDDLRTAVSDLADFVQAHEPQLISYGVYLDEQASTMTVVAVHPDSASLGFHLRIGGPEFRKVGAFITLRLIEVFGDPNEDVLDQLNEKARVLGNAEVVIRPRDAGFARI